jgi:hypothetical protein
MKEIIGTTIIYRNSKGQYHRTDGPAVEFADGSKAYYIDGKRLTILPKESIIEPGSSF